MNLKYIFGQMRAVSIGARSIGFIGLTGLIALSTSLDASAAQRGIRAGYSSLQSCTIQPSKVIPRIQALCANSSLMHSRVRDAQDSVSAANPEFFSSSGLKKEVHHKETREKENDAADEEVIQYCARITGSKNVSKVTYLDHIPSRFIENLCAASPLAETVTNAINTHHTRTARTVAAHNEHEQPCIRPAKAHPAHAHHLHSLMEAPHALLASHPPMERFKPAVDSYLELVEKNGRRPDFRPSAPTFEKARLEEVDGLVPEFKIAGPRPAADELGPYYETFLKSLPKGTFHGVSAKDLELVAPKTAPGSGAFVFLIKNKKTGEVIAALKIQDAERGLDEIMSVTAAERLIHERSPHTPIVKTIAAGKLVEPHSSHPKPEKSSYFIIQTAAHGSDLTSYMRAIGKAETPEARQAAQHKADAATKVVAHTLADLHKGMRQAKVQTPEVVARFQENAEFESARLQKGLLGSEDTLGSLKSGVTKGELTPELADRITKKVEALDKAYLKLTKERPDLFSLTYNHGDFHNGNAFVSEKPDGTFHTKGELIDYGTLLWNAGKKNEVGTGDPAADAGRISAALMTSALQNGSPVKEAIDQAKTFLDAYKHSAGFHRGSTEEKAFELSVQFHMNRLFNLESSDPNKKFTSSRVPSADLRKSLYVLIDDVFSSDYDKVVERLTRRSPPGAELIPPANLPVHKRN